ncbi:MAG: hypothetical protein F7B60_04565 [Desulfurococcales archaeon]|nr:hypothetical protein [Desulfurococcales archaeon]
MLDILVRGDSIFLDEYNLISNGYVYIKDGIIEKVGSQPVPEEFEYATLVIGGSNRVIIPALGIAYSDIGLYDMHPYNRGSLENRLHSLRRRDDAAIISSINRGLFDLNIHGVAIIGIEMPSYWIAVDLEEKTGVKVNAIMEKCPEDSNHCLVPKHLREGGNESNIIYLNSSEQTVFYRGRTAPALVNRFSYNPCYMGADNLLSNTKIAFESRGLNWGIYERNPAYIAVFNFNEPPHYLANLTAADIMDVLSTCKRIESLIIENDLVIDAGEHLTIGRKNMGQ